MMNGAKLMSQQSRLQLVKAAEQKLAHEATPRINFNLEFGDLKYKIATNF